MSCFCVPLSAGSDEDSSVLLNFDEARTRTFEPEAVVVVKCDFEYDAFLDRLAYVSRSLEAALDGRAAVFWLCPGDSVDAVDMHQCAVAIVAWYLAADVVAVGDLLGMFVPVISSGSLDTATWRVVLGSDLRVGSELFDYLFRSVLGVEVPDVTVYGPASPFVAMALLEAWVDRIYGQNYSVACVFHIIARMLGEVSGGRFFGDRRFDSLDGVTRKAFELFAHCLNVQTWVWSTRVRGSWPSTPCERDRDVLSLTWCARSPTACRSFKAAFEKWLVPDRTCAGRAQTNPETFFFFFFFCIAAPA